MRVCLDILEAIEGWREGDCYVGYRRLYIQEGYD